MAQRYWAKAFVFGIGCSLVATSLGGCSEAKVEDPKVEKTVEAPTSQPSKKGPMVGPSGKLGKPSTMPTMMGKKPDRAPTQEEREAMQAARKALDGMEQQTRMRVQILEMCRSRKVSPEEVKAGFMDRATRLKALEQEIKADPDASLKCMMASQG